MPAGQAPRPQAAYEITQASYLRDRPSMTFHGRDIFAPAAAYILMGSPLEDFGGVVADRAFSMGLSERDRVVTNGPDPRTSPVPKM